MNRRELIKQISLLTGAAVIGSEFFLSGCKNSDNTPGLYSSRDIAFFDEVAETIIPKTNTPGAKDAEVGKFMAHYANDCYDTKNQSILKEGIDKLNNAADSKYKKDFLSLTAEEKQALLTTIDAEAKEYESAKKENDPKHYFTLMKQLTMLGFFTSKPGVTQVLRYNPVPGKYEGCINYNGETSWA